MKQIMHKKRQKEPQKPQKTAFEVLVGEDGFEPSKRNAADLQTAKRCCN
jgi:hypothetical protein